MPLYVSVGANYDELERIIVNHEEPVEIESPHAKIQVVVRIRNYHDPQTHEVTNSPYFEQEAHASTQLSIQIGLQLKETVDGDSLLFGNDFDQPIRNMLPYGFSVAFAAFKWIDPSVDGDVYADSPYLYGKFLTSFNVIQRDGVDEQQHQWKGGPDTGFHLEETISPQHPNSYERSKYFLSKEHREIVELTPDYIYTADFCTAHLTMGDQFSIQLPGFKYDVGKYCGSQPLRYVLKNKDGQVYLVVQFDAQKEDAEHVVAETTDQN